MTAVLPARFRNGTHMLVRVALAVPAGAVLLFAFFAPASTYEALLASDGRITQAIFLHLIRGTLAAVSGVLLGVALIGRRELVHNVLVATIALLLVAVGLEGALRIQHALAADDALPEPRGLRASSVPGLIYENSPGFVEGDELTFNSLGMRDEERPLATGAAKIVVVGDSIESWRAVRASSLYPRVLEASLRESLPDSPHQVINLAVTGYSLRQKVAMLEQRGLSYDPKMVIVGYCLNDPVPAWGLVNYFEGALPSHAWRSELFALVSGRIRTILWHRGVDFYHAVHQPGTEFWTGIKHDLARLGTIGRERGIVVVLTIFPIMIDSEPYRWAGVHRRLRAVAEREGLRVVDMLPDLQRSGFVAVRDDSIHPNALGHRIIADRLREEVVRDGWLRGRREENHPTRVSMLPNATILGRTANGFDRP